MILGLVAGLLTSQIGATALHVHLSDDRDDHHHGLAAHHHDIPAHDASTDLLVVAYGPDQDRLSVSLATVIIPKMQAPSAMLTGHATVVCADVASRAASITDVRTHGPPHRATVLLRAPPAIHPA